MRSSTSRWIRSQIAVPYGFTTIVPRASEFSARSAPRTTSWYQAGKSSDCFGRAMAEHDSNGYARAVVSSAVVPKDARAFVAQHDGVQAVVQRIGADTFDLILIDA